MRIVIYDGGHNADYIINMFSQYKKHDLTIINPDREFCQYISQKNDIDVYYGDATKEYVLEENHVYGADVFISLAEKDTDNYVACTLAKERFHIKKCICTVTNPKNVDVFKKLGINSVISSTYLLAESIKNQSTMERLIKTLSVEDEKIVLTEIEIGEGDYICNLALKNAKFPRYATISCVFRNPDVIIPSGETVISQGDRIIIISELKHQEDIVQFVKEGK